MLTCRAPTQSLQHARWYLSTPKGALSDTNSSKKYWTVTGRRTRKSSPFSLSGGSSRMALSKAAPRSCLFNVVKSA